MARTARERPRAGLAEAVAHAHVAQAVHRRDVAGGHRAPRHGRSPLEHLDGSHLAVAVRAEPRALPNPERAREHADVGHLVPAGVTLHLEHQSRRGGIGVVGREREQGGERAHQLTNAGARLGRAEEHRTARAQPPSDRGNDPIGVGPGAVDLVDEDQRRDPQPAKGAHQHHRLRLHALHRGDDEHRAVEHAQRPVDLGDEVGVARRVDDVDDRVADGERDDGGANRDAAPALEIERVGLGRAVVDPADRVYDAGCVEQPFRQARLTCVDMSQDPKVQRGQGLCRPSPRVSRRRWGAGTAGGACSRGAAAYPRPRPRRARRTRRATSTSARRPAAAP